MRYWQSLRISGLAVTLAGVWFVFGKFSTDPSLGRPTPYAFPQTVPLPDWRTVSEPIAARNQQRYRYIRGQDSLDVEMRYLVDTNGDFKQFIEDHTSIAAPANQILQAVRYREGVGFYGLSHYQGRAYLSACIPPVGESTVTREQFRRTLTAYDRQPSRLLAWLLAQGDLRDRRCLWSHLSTPTAGRSPEAAYQTLEATWFVWYKWWKPRFPQL